MPPVTNINLLATKNGLSFFGMPPFVPDESRFLLGRKTESCENSHHAWQGRNLLLTAEYEVVDQRERRCLSQVGPRVPATGCVTASSDMSIFLVRSRRVEKSHAAAFNSRITDCFSINTGRLSWSSLVCSSICHHADSGLQRLDTLCDSSLGLTWRLMVGRRHLKARHSFASTALRRCFRTACLTVQFELLACLPCVLGFFGQE